MKPLFKILPLRLVLPLAILVVAAGAAAWLVKTKPELKPAPPRELNWTVAVEEARRGDEQPVIRLFGEVVAGRAVELRALVAGEVVEVGGAMHEGGLVRKGELLAAVDEFDYQASLAERRAELAEVRARLVETRARLAMQKQALTQDREMVALSERELARAETLAKRGNVSDKALDSARMELTRQRQSTLVRENELTAEGARVEQQKAQLARAETAVKRAERDLENVRLTAPFDGVLSDVQAELGQRLGLNDRVARLTDIGRLEVRLTLSEAQFGRLSRGGNAVVGRPVAVTWRHGDSLDRYEAKVERIGARIDSASGGVDVYVRIADTDLDSAIRPGAFVELELPDRTYADVVRLPETVLYEEKTVYVVEGERLAARRVSLAARSGNDVLLTGELKDGDRVVTTRYPDIGPGQKVQVRKQ